MMFMFVVFSLDDEWQGKTDKIERYSTIIS